ncbi:hypothetical protein C8J56DRAFT_1025424 [Mycena floridula]|nr:hypothetical protein C8J56DRAFT_1025424 [Mycena floridula]
MLVSSITLAFFFASSVSGVPVPSASGREKLVEYKPGNEDYFKEFTHLHSPSPEPAANSRKKSPSSSSRPTPQADTKGKRKATSRPASSSPSGAKVVTSPSKASGSSSSSKSKAKKTASQAEKSEVNTKAQVWDLAYGQARRCCKTRIRGQYRRTHNKEMPEAQVTTMMETWKISYLREHPVPPNARAHLKKYELGK